MIVHEECSYCHRRTGDVEVYDDPDGDYVFACHEDATDWDLGTPVPEDVLRRS